MNAVASFVDRERELRALNDAFATATRGESRVLVLEGEAGIGKTTLIDRFLASRRDTRVLRAAGEESETDVPFAAADQLLRAAESKLDALRCGRHVAVGLELLELITSEPSVVVVDDAHLADADSLRALLFAARRLGRGHALVILAVRGAAADALPEGWGKLADVLTVARLAPAHIRA